MQALPHLSVLTGIAVQVNVVEGLLDGWNLLVRLMRWLLQLLHSHRLVIVRASLRIESLLIGVLLALTRKGLLLRRHVLSQVGQLWPILVSDSLSLEPFDYGLFGRALF